MGAKKQIDIIRKLLNEQEYHDAISSSNPKVVVLDLHLDWCGPCQVIEPNFRTIYFAIDNCAERLEFLTIGEKEMPDSVFQKLNLTSKPRFQIWFNGKMHQEIDGVDLVSIEKKIYDLLPNLDD